ncbi:MAG TPA: copper homeostasis protein CutC [Bacteroidia bacterium]|nr:copper homeostasis protein CutC [Bacteroidia bacterium]
MKNILEIAAFSPEAAIIAANAGADRIELCSAYAEGGLTPSLSAMEFVKQNVRIPVFIMIRPRGGDFVYSEIEKAVMKQDILHAKNTGADGIVLGVLTKENHVDELLLKELVHLCSPLPVTFHRAFDLCPDPFEAMETLIRCGVKRILTSGQKATAEKGGGTIAALHEKANGKIILMPGAGISPANIFALMKKTGCAEFHASAKSPGTPAGVFGFGENILPDAAIIAELKKKISL